MARRSASHRRNSASLACKAFSFASRVSVRLICSIFCAGTGAAALYHIQCRPRTAMQVCQHCLSIWGFEGRSQALQTRIEEVGCSSDRQSAATNEEMSQRQRSASNSRLLPYPLQLSPGPSHCLSPMHHQRCLLPIVRLLEDWQCPAHDTCMMRGAQYSSGKKLRSLWPASLPALRYIRSQLSPAVGNLSKCSLCTKTNAECLSGCSLTEKGLVLRSFEAKGLSE